MIARLRQLRERLKRWSDSPTITPTMTKTFVVAVFAAAFIVPLAIVALPYIEFFNDMAVQHKVKPQMAWTRAQPDRPLAIGDRPTPPGTLPRGVYPYPFPSPETDVAEQAGRELRADNPLIAPPYQPPLPSLEMLERGRKHFETYCITCHGRYGFGDGSVARMGFPAPPSLLDQQARAFPLGRLFHIETMGQNLMPGYALQLPPEDRWAVAYYLRALHEAFPAPPGGNSATPGLAEPAPTAPEDTDGRP